MVLCPVPMDQARVSDFFTTYGIDRRSLPSWRPCGARDPSLGTGAGTKRGRDRLGGSADRNDRQSTAGCAFWEADNRTFGR